MIFLSLFLYSVLAFSGSPAKWEYARAIVDRHEFYKNDEEILTPANTWQALFAVSYMDAHLNSVKDCVFYRVPGDDPGKLKVKSVSVKTDCTSEILSPGDIEIEKISRLSFSTTDRSISLEYIQDSKPEKWNVTLVSDWKKPEPKLLLSSADYKSPRMIYLAPAKSGRFDFEALKDKVLCHDVDQDCREKSPSQCGHCENGWIEIPNGCLKGPKICGATPCGGKDLPACRRGISWQRKESQFDCRTDASFAWCSKGLAVSCDGDKAYCR